MKKISTFVKIFEKKINKLFHYANQITRAISYTIHNREKAF